jgi:hypothetical protein
MSQNFRPTSVSLPNGTAFAIAVLARKDSRSISSYINKVMSAHISDELSAGTVTIEEITQIGGAHGE